MLTKSITKMAMSGHHPVPAVNLMMFPNMTTQRTLYHQVRNNKSSGNRKTVTAVRPALISTHSQLVPERDKFQSEEHSFMESMEAQILHMNQNNKRFDTQCNKTNSNNNFGVNNSRQHMGSSSGSVLPQIDHKQQEQYNTSGHTRLNQAVQWYSNQAAIEAAARKPVCRLAPDAILYGGNDSMKMAQYLHKELPIRIAHRIVDFRCLPFIVGCDSKISYVHDLYIRAFHLLSSFPQITDKESRKAYARMLRQLLDDHKDVVSLLAEGFRACRRYIENETIRCFLDRTLASRLGIRLLAEHYLGQEVERPNHVGIINKRMQPKLLIEKWCLFAQRLCETNYGRSPVFKIQGHTNASFPYFEIPLNYIIPELLKNAARATVEFYPDSEQLPDVTITIAHNERDFIIKVSDFGGGIAHDHVEQVFKYHFSTSDQRKHHDLNAPTTQSTATTQQVPLNTTNEITNIATSVSRANSTHTEGSSYDEQMPMRVCMTAQQQSGSKSYFAIGSGGSVTTKSSQQSDGSTDARLFDSIMKDPIAGDMHGFGFGLPISRAYAQYLGGDLQISSMQGIGTDVYLRLMHLTSKHENFVI
ncbi:[3-methyl-2-oxobutanoate dehydrogenase [lipoamide]] kinase, mitochondrial [Fragariocoptes setiger]|uniref:Protein-serine/threonine kinase n=1 Tax=Fragariocoptes setiger TaxID=1670756 RepID=A0ABQ7S666_9ACAR|nr:[3-methyl-2-oxobutanoate dehydrogenase [lipoamide]] kinase, mitochondrial [Fragariocoptes setiger]